MCSWANTGANAFVSTPAVPVFSENAGLFPKGMKEKFGSIQPAEEDKFAR